MVFQAANNEIGLQLEFSNSLSIPRAAQIAFLPAALRQEKHANEPVNSLTDAFGRYALKYFDDETQFHNESVRYRIQVNAEQP